MKRLLAKLFGYKHNYGGLGRDYRFVWGEISLWTKDIAFKWVGPKYCYEPKFIIGLYFITFFFPTPTFGVKSAQDSKEQRDYGFYLYSNLHNWSTTVFMFYNKSWHIYMPWTYEWESTELLDWDMNTVVKEHKKDRNWEKYYRQAEEYKKNNSKVFDYTYYLNNGEVQHRKASITVERRTWYVRGWPWKKMINTSIDVVFNEEVGERSGSWKGGTIGCSYEMLPNETPEHCLLRMESERKF